MKNRYTSTAIYRTVILAYKRRNLFLPNLMAGNLDHISKEKTARRG